MDLHFDGENGLCVVSEFHNISLKLGSPQMDIIFDFFLVYLLLGALENYCLKELNFRALKSINQFQISSLYLLVFSVPPIYIVVEIVSILETFF